MFIDSKNSLFNMGNVDKNFQSNSSNNFSSDTSRVSDTDWYENLPTYSLPPHNYSENLFLEENELSLYDLDTRLTQIDLDTASDSSEKIHSFNKSLFDSDGEDSIDLHGWKRKRVEDWDETDTINWVISAGLKIGHSYGRMSPEFAIPGKELLGLTKDNFIAIDQEFGEELFNLLHKRNEAINSQSSSEYSSDDETSRGGDDAVSDGDSDCGSEPGKKWPGRPTTAKKVKEPRLKLWEFIRNALHNPEYCPRFICWDDYHRKTFRFVQSAQMAKLWGERVRGGEVKEPHKTKPKTKKMTFDNFSRAMRYYYKKGIFVTVPGRRLVYKFGPNATGLETDCPNFDPNYYSNLQKSKF